MLGMEEIAEGAENGQRAVEVSIAPAEPSQSLGPLLERALSEVHSTTALIVIISSKPIITSRLV